jgi:hypothetical protein
MKSSDIPKYPEKDKLSSKYYELTRREEENYEEELCKLFNIPARSEILKDDKEVDMLANIKSEYGKINLPDDFIELLKKLSGKFQSDESDVVKKGLVFLGLVDRVKQQGFKLAVVDDEGNLIANLEGY